MTRATRPATPADVTRLRNDKGPITCQVCGVTNAFTEFVCVECGESLHPTLAGKRMIPVESSNVEAIGHDGNNLFVWFRSGSRYVYFGVPDSVYEDMTAASSMGTFLHRHVKGVYPYDRLDAEAV